MSLEDFKDRYGLSGVGYADLRWLDKINISLKYNVEIFVKEIDKNLILALPIFNNKIGYIKFCGAPLSGSFTGYYDIISNKKKICNSYKVIFINEIETYLKNNNYHYIELPIFGMENTEKEILCSNFKKLETLTLKIENLDKAWATISGRARTSIRKAQKFGLEISEVSKDLTHINQFYRMYKKTFEDRGIKAPHPFQLFRSISSLSFVKIYRAYQGEQTLGYGVFGEFTNRTIYLAGTLSEEGKKFSASSLIQWHAISKAHYAGLKLHDLGGIGNISIDKFKSSFSKVSEVRYFRVYSSRLWRVIFPIANFFRRIGLLTVN